MVPQGQPEADSLAMFALTGNAPEAIVELTTVVEKALAMADALELSLVGIELCSALERLKRMQPDVDPVEGHDND
jgi:hypothetical protein